MRECRLNWLKMLHNTYIFHLLPHPLPAAFSSKMFCWIQRIADRQCWKSSRTQPRAELPTSCWFDGPLDYISKHHLQSWPSVQYCPGNTLRFGCCTLQGLPVGICLNHAPLWVVVTIYNAVTVIALGRVRRR